MATVLTPDLPFALQLELTSTCNLRCRMCPLTTGTSSTSGNPGPVTEATWDEVRRFARRCQQVFIAGYGEPLTNPRCLDLLRDLDDAGVQTTIATNGLVLTEAIARGLAGLRHLVQVNVSIDSPDPDVYRAVRGGNLDRALRGLRQLVDALHPAQITVSSVLMQQTAASLVDMPALLAELGVRHYDLQGVMDYNEFAQSESLLGMGGLAATVDAIRRSCERHGVYLVVGNEQRLELELADADAARARYHDRPGDDAGTARQCMVPWELPFVDKDGQVFACCYAASANERVLGDVRTSSFEDVWHGEAFQRFRSDLLDGRTTPEVCRGCTVVPLGEHPMRAWAGRIVDGSVRVDRDELRVQVRNEGSRAWTRDDLVRVGTRDGDSAVAHPSWLFPSRAATFTADVVGPGEVATFVVQLLPAREAVTQRFDVVVEGLCWLPGLSFTVTVPSARRRLPASLRRLARAPEDPPVAGFAADLVSHAVSAGGTRVRVQVRNTGTRGWTHADGIRIGTADPRDADCAAATTAWLQPNRPCTFDERAVPVGGIATFAFELAAPPSAPLSFQLVADGFCWLRGTRFTVPAAPADGFGYHRTPEVAPSRSQNG